MSNNDTPTFSLNLGGGRNKPYQGAHSPAMFEGVMSRRVVAHILDFIAIFILTAILSIPFFFLGILTFGLLFIFYGLFVAAVALAYITLSLGGENGATPGMRAMRIELRTLDGYRPTLSLAFIYGFLFYATVTIATPLILLIGLFNARGRLAHDFLSGTVMVNTPARIDGMRRR